MGMMNSKKGIMFTVLAVMVSAIILTSFFMFSSSPLDEGVDNVKLRVQGINKYTVQTDEYIAAVANVAGEKTLEFTLNIMIGNNSFLTNYTKEFQSCLMTGKMNVPWPGPAQTLIDCPNDSKIISRIDYFQNFSNAGLNIDSKIKVNAVVLEQSTPWELIVKVNYTLLVNDSYAQWNETRFTQTAISIIGLRDPVYYIVNNSSAYAVRYDMVINSSIYPWVEKPSALHRIVLEKKYFYWSPAPSYLDRLNNRSTPSLLSKSAGIVSIVSPDFISNKTILINRSSLDYEFWVGAPLNPGYDYKKYNFWNTGISSDQRTEYGVYAFKPGLNGTILPDDGNNFMRSTTKMNDVIYLILPLN